MYPIPVIEISKEIYDVFEENLVEEIKRPKEWCKPIGMEVISEFMLPKFLSEGELKLTEKEIDTLYRKCLAELGITSLKEKGLVDIIENENGEEIVFLTSEGKELNKKLGQ